MAASAERLQLSGTELLTHEKHLIGLVAISCEGRDFWTLHSENVRVYIVRSLDFKMEILCLSSGYT